MMALIIHSNPTLLTTQNGSTQMLSLNGTIALSSKVLNTFIQTQLSQIVN